MVEEFELIKSEFKNEISELKKETNQKLHDHLKKLSWIEQKQSKSNNGSNQMMDSVKSDIEKIRLQLSTLSTDFRVNAQK